MKNIIFIPAIDAGRGRHHSYDYSIKSWKKWADLYDHEVLVWDEALYSWDEMTIPWQRYHLFKILEQNKIDYGQVLMVDCDTIINPNTPNFFEMTDYKYSAVLDNGCWEWTGRSLRHYKDLFDNYKVERGLYFNGGFQIVNESHKEFFDEVLDFYFTNQNILREKHMSSKNLLNFGQSWWGDGMENLYEQAWVYHFNAIPTNQMDRDSAYFMKRTYEELYK